MDKRNKTKFFLTFLGGFASALLLVGLVLWGGQASQASGPADCLKVALNYSTVLSNAGAGSGQQIEILYHLPTCADGSVFDPKEVSYYSGNHVRVLYQKN